MKMIQKRIIGLRPWEIKEQDKENVDLSTFSGEIVAMEGEEK